MGEKDRIESSQDQWSREKGELGRRESESRKKNPTTAIIASGLDKLEPKLPEPETSHVLAVAITVLDAYHE